MRHVLWIGGRIMTRARDIADFGSVSARLDTVGGSEGALSNRNLIINGGQTVSQRGTSFTSQTSGTNYYTDRWAINFSSIGTWTISQSTEAPSGFGYSLKADCTTADASPAASDNIHIITKLEGQNLQALDKGSSSAKSCTLSFWVKSNKTGVGQCNLRDIDNNRMISATYNINAANTWEHKTMTFAGDTTGSFDNDNAASLQIEWWLDSGSNNTSGTVQTSWAARNVADRAAGLTLSLADSTSNEFYLTGVQLEVGDTATPFEHRSYGDELLRCKRYFQVMKTGLAIANGTSDIRIAEPLEIEMRSTPSLGKTSGTFFFGDMISAGAGSTSTPSINGTTTQNNKTINANIGGFGGSLTSYRTYRHEPQSSYVALITVDAEL